MKNLFERFFSLPFSFYWCLKAFNFRDALKLPLYISYKTKVSGIQKGSFDFANQLHFGMFRMGFNEGSFGGGLNKPTKLMISGGV